MSAYTGCKFQVRQRGVGDLRMQDVRPHRFYARRLLSRHGEDHRQVVRRKGPKDILLASEFSQVQPVGINILQPAELSLPDHSLDFDNRRVVLQNMADKKHPVHLAGEFHQIGAFPFGDCQGLLYKHVLAGEKSVARHGIMQFGGSGDGHGVDIPRREHLGEREPHGDIGKFRGFPFKDFLGRVADHPESVQLVKIPRQVLTPIARTDQCNSD